MGKLKEIEARLKAATPGPWTPLLKSKGMTGVHGPGCKIYHVELDPVCCKETHARQKADAAFIANAPTDITYLLNRVQKLEGVLKKLNWHSMAREALEEGDND